MTRITNNLFIQYFYFTIKTNKCNTNCNNTMYMYCVIRIFFCFLNILGGEGHNSPIPSMDTPLDTWVVNDLRPEVDD